MPIQSNVSHPIGLDQWRETAGSGKDRVITGDFSNALGRFVGNLFQSSADQNRAAFDNLFSAIHASNPAPTLMGSLRDLLEPQRDAGKPLSSSLIHAALDVADNFTPPGCEALGRKWSSAAVSVPVLLKSDESRNFVDAFNLTVADHFARLGGHATLNQKRLMLADMRMQVRDAHGAGPEIKAILDTMLRTREQQLAFGHRARTSDSPYLNRLRSPEADVYRLVMDGNRHGYGPWNFEDERGYMAGMLGGLNHMLHHLDAPLTADLYRQMHGTAVKGVHGLDDRPPLRRGFRDNTSVSFRLISGANATDAGAREFLSSAKHTGAEGWMTLSQDRSGFSTLVAGRRSADQCREKAQQIIDTYHRELAQARRDEGAILRCIAKCCQDLDQHHFFSDGNIRTVVFLTMNKLLLQNGLSPTMLRDPNIVDMYSIDEIVAAIREGQAAYRGLLV